MEEKINDILENYAFSQNDIDTIKKYEKSVKDFEKLIDRGVIRSRGYNLQTIDDASDGAKNEYVIN